MVTFSDLRKFEDGKWNEIEPESLEALKEWFKGAPEGILETIEKLAADRETYQGIIP